MRFLPAVSMLLATAALTSCDAHQPLQSEGGAVSAEPQAGVTSESGGEGGSQVIGTFSMPTPLADKANKVAGYQPVTSTGMTLQPNTYVLLRVGGTVEMKMNPWLPGAGSGEVMFSYSAQESRVTTGRGVTSVYMGFADITGSFRVDAGGRDVIRLVHILSSSPVELRASRQALPVQDMRAGGFCLVPYCAEDEVAERVEGWLYGYWVERYWISQSHEITATQIDKPLWIESSPLVPGSPVRAEAHLFSGLRLRDAAGGIPQINWVWYPGHPSAPTGETIALTQCWNKLVCDFTPTKPGRLRVWTTVEGSPVDVVEFLPVEESRLELTCPESVTRGEEMTCTVAATPSGTLTDIRWSFRDSAGHEVPGPDDAHRWGGRLVVPGAMELSATLNGATVDTTASIGIRPRRWPRINVRAVDGGNGDLPAYPRFIWDLAHTNGPVPSQPIRLGLIDSGPNTGWHFVSAPLTHVDAVVNISQGFQSGQPFHTLQHSGTDPITGDPFCTKSQLPAVRQGAREHEGISSSSTIISHVEVYRRWFRNNRPQDALEAIVDHRSNFNPDWTFEHVVASEFATKVADRAVNDPNQRHTADTPPGLVAFPVVPCRPRFFP